MLSIDFSQFSYFAAVTSNCNPNTDNPDSGTFFGFPHWWQYIKTGQFDNSVNPPLCTPVVDFPAGLWAIGFAVIDMLLYLAGIVAVISIIIAGIGYITAQGNTEKTTSARRRIVNSLIGLAVVVIASLVVRFIGDKVG